MRSGNEKGERAALMSVADVKVAESPEIADSHPTGPVKAVSSDSVLKRRSWQRRGRLEPGLEGLKRSPTVDRAMRSLLVVIDAKGVQLELQMNQALGPAPLSDFFSVDTVFLRRLYVLSYVELATRRVIWLAVTEHPDASWVSQQARNVSWELNELGVHARFLIHDHDHKYGGGSDLVFKPMALA